MQGLCFWEPLKSRCDVQPPSWKPVVSMLRMPPDQSKEELVFSRKCVFILFLRKNTCYELFSLQHAWFMQYDHFLNCIQIAFFCLLWHSNWGWRNASIFVFAMCYWWVYTIKVLALSKQAHRKQIKVPTQLALFLVTFVSISCYLSTYDGVYFGTNGLVWTDIMNRLGAEKAQKFVERSWFQNLLQQFQLFF